MNEVLKKMAESLEASWNATDAAIHAAFNQFTESHKDERFDIGWGYKVTADTKFTAALTEHERNACHYGARWYSDENKKAAFAFVSNLEKRVAAITGEVAEWAKSSTEQSLSSYIVKGAKGTAKVSQIYAGGYNIVRLHIRNIVKAM